MVIENLQDCPAHSIRVVTLKWVQIVYQEDKVPLLIRLVFKQHHIQTSALNSVLLLEYVLDLN